MKAVRLHVTQPVAHYHRGESIDNRMTYPLPQPSTVIGALHAACGYNSYHPMDVSIQGRFGSLQKEIFTSHCFLNTVMDDRGMLVKVPNGEFLSGQYIPVAKAKKSQGNSFKKGITIDDLNEELLEEYRELMKKKDAFDEEKKGRLADVCNPLETKAKELLAAAKKADKEEAKALKEKAKALKAEAKAYKDEFKDREEREYTLPMSCYKDLTTIPQYYETLYEVELVIHIRADEDVLRDIMDCIDNLSCIGRSEDFVTVEDCRMVELSINEKEKEIQSPYTMYVYSPDFDEIIKATGYRTKYYVSKVYHLEEKTGKRIFSKVPVILTSLPSVDVECDEDGRTFIDITEADMPLVVNFL